MIAPEGLESPHQKARAPTTPPAVSEVRKCRVRPYPQRDRNLPDKSDGRNLKKKPRKKEKEKKVEVSRYFSAVGVGNVTPVVSALDAAM